jgi:50S ribosomal protein L16 3-hydroxylase
MNAVKHCVCVKACNNCLHMFCCCRFEGEITADELAGLSCIDDVESRIISYKQSTTASDADNTAAAAVAAVEWSVRHGPFDDDTFDDPELGDSNWTLLVNEANRHLPEVSDLLTNFEFVPNWRVDDIMISYATTGGGVGPHVDSYDVFLLQGSGQRQWSIGVYIPTKYSFSTHIGFWYIGNTVHY